MMDYPDFEQNYYFRTAKCFYKIDHDSIQLLKWIVYYDRYYGNIH